MGESTTAAVSDGQVCGLVAACLVPVCVGAAALVVRATRAG